MRSIKLFEKSNASKQICVNLCELVARKVEYFQLRHSGED